MQDKLKELKDNLRTYDHLAVALSGGVDSTFLLMAAKQVLGPAVIAVTLTGPNFADDEFIEAKKLCDDNDIPQLVINMPDEVFARIAPNTEDRCYICKRAMFELILETLPGTQIVDGSNTDDLNDLRPGARALKELGIRSPLQEVGFSKEDVRAGLRAMNMPIWKKPAYACLATRIPFGEELTVEKLKAVYTLEKYIRALGFPQVRVRHRGDIAMIEVAPHMRESFAAESIMDKVNQKALEIGFRYAAMDLGGYKMGHLNPDGGK